MAGVIPIGLDIGSTSIRAVEVRRARDEYSLTNFGQVPLPPGTVQGGMLMDPLALTSALKQLWAACKFNTRKVMLGVTNPQLVVRETSVSNLPAKEMRRSLPFQVRDMLPLAVERSLLDFRPLEEPGDNPTVRGLLIAMPKEAVMALVEAVEKAGLRVVNVDLASFAMLRAASRLDAQVEAIVDIGAEVTSVVVHADGEPLIVRTVPRGGVEVTANIAARLDISTAEAEALKCRFGLHGDDRPDTAAAVTDAIRPLVNELRRAFS
jgi:type IV pilus assembly protein PilM